jgi:hypothetical protein
MKYVFAYTCEKCDHLATEHRLDPSAPDIDGPYVCLATIEDSPEGLTCWCDMRRGDPVVPLGKQQYDRHLARRPQERDCVIVAVSV